jgi:glycosyltransferase involved in cell wall biosynthesis
MATYNGEKFLNQQIDSICNQTNKDWTLYIRDDGSVDSSLSIIKTYQNKYTNIFLLEDNQLHRGAKDSFIWLLENVESEYYMFCDQDDVWLNFKIDVSFLELVLLEDKNRYIPSLVFTDLFVVDSSLNIISNSMWEYTQLDKITNFMYLLVTPLVTGCTTIFNNSAKLSALKFKSNAIMHDSMLALSVYANGGKLKAIFNSSILYRQHDKNTLGISKYNKSLIARLYNLKYYIRINYRYFKQAHSITNVSLTKYIFLKLKLALYIRNANC